MAVKISALPVAGSVINADIIPVVHAGVTDQCSRSLYLTDSNAEGIGMFGTNNSLIGMDNAGGVACFAGAGLSASLNTNDSTGFVCTDGVGITISCFAGNTFTLLCGVSTITIDALGVIAIIDVAGASVFVTYVAAVPGNWLAAPPPDLATAIDRLVAVVAVLNGGPV